ASGKFKFYQELRLQVMGKLFRKQHTSITLPYSPLRDVGTQDFLLENITPDLMGDIGGCL
ncbi:hypothetical protein, partial [Pseudomonas syringae]|uniref:hypothetical protein n=1 Tax=Pseudomonas syringae TaxID=317 RepID=UPI001A7E15CA